MINKQVAVWVYNDEGASELSIQSVLTTIKEKLSADIIAVQTISSQEILANKLNKTIDSESTSIGVFIMPGGADLPYCKKLNGQGNDNIRQFISEGNVYIGICAGGYYGASAIQFSGQSYENGCEKGSKKGYEINGARELAFFSGTAIGSIATLCEEHLYDETVSSKAMATFNYANGQQDEVYYHGGAYFSADCDANFNVVATYIDGKNAVVSGDFGHGKYLLSGVHFELCPDIYERYAVEEASKGDIERERSLLVAINHKDYGKLVYREIAEMIEGVGFSKPT